MNKQLNESKTITNKEAIEQLREHISAIMLYVTEARLDEKEVENELLNIEALEMAIEALQFQDIMINNPKTSKPTPEVCKNCKGNTQDDWTPVSEDIPTEDGEYLAQYISGSMDVIPWAEGWNCFRDIDGTVVRRCEIKSVVAWRPKPKPYKEK